MIYVFDTSSFIVLGHYFPDRFPSFWNHFDNHVSDGNIISVREVLGELSSPANKPHLAFWLKINKSIFAVPGDEETRFISEIFTIPSFQQLVKQKQISKGNRVADPFVIASARVKNACVVTEEAFRENAAKIPNVCQHFHIDCTNLEGFMERENWTF